MTGSVFVLSLVENMYLSICLKTSMYVYQSLTPKVQALLSLGSDGGVWKCPDIYFVKAVL